LLPKKVSAKAWPSRIATGVSWTRSVTSPTAKIDGTLVRLSASTLISPLSPSSTPGRLEAEPSTLGTRPTANSTCVGLDIVAAGHVDGAASRRRASRSLEGRR
jgi:hypothetical protein